MIARPWDRDKDYDTLVKWWTDWEFGTVPKECLPPSGIVVSEDGKDICAGGLYIGEGTQFGFMEWIVTDKSAEPKTVAQWAGSNTKWPPSQKTTRHTSDP